MSPRPRIASVSVASAAAIGLSVAIGVAPPATAGPCTGAAAAAQPPAPPAPTPALPSSPDGPPRGHKPVGANERAPLPRLGQLSLAILNAFSPRSARVQRQAGVMPAPNPPGTGNQPPPNAIQQAPAAAPAQPPPPGAAAWDIACRLGDRTGQPERHHPTFRHHRDRPRDHVGQRRSHQPSGAYGLRRHVRLLQRPRPAMAVQHAVPQPRRRSVQNDQCAEWRCLQQLLRLTSMGAGPFQADHQQHQVGANREGNRSDRRHRRRGTQYVNFMSIKSWDSDGRWTTNFSAIAVSPDNGEHWGIYPGSVRTPAEGRVASAPYVAGNENFQQGAFLRPGPGDPYLYSFGTPTGRGGPAYVARVPQGLVPDLTKYEYWNSYRESMGPKQSGGRDAGDPRPGGRNVGPIQHLSQAIPGALLQRCQRRRGKDCAGSARTVESRANAREVSGNPGGIYAPYLHPWSTGKELYFNLSLWSA